MLLLPEDKFTLAIKCPAGKCAGGFFDIILCIVAPAKGEEFHYFAGEIFIWMLFFVLAVIQKLQHRRAFGHATQHVGKITKCVLPEYIQQFLVIIRIVDVGGEMAMPEQTHLFQKWEIGVNHCLHP